MKRILLAVLCVILVIGAFIYYRGTDLATQKTKTTQALEIPEAPVELYSGSGAFNYKNLALGFSFTTNSPLYQRETGVDGYLITSNNRDPHFYENKDCAYADVKIPECTAFEIQKVVLPNQKRVDILNSLQNKTSLSLVSNDNFDFYKQSYPGAPGWTINYFAVSKTEDIYFNILTLATSSTYLEKEVLPTFKQIN